MSNTGPDPIVPAPPDYLDRIRQDGMVDNRYLRHFANRLSQVLINRSHTEIMVLGQMIHEATVRYRLPDGSLSVPYWQQWPGDTTYDKFDARSGAILHCRQSKAYRLRKIYLDITAMNLSEHTMARVLRLGWGKVDAMLRVARSEMTLIQWLDRIEEHGINYLDLRDEVKLSSEAAGTGRSSAGEVTSTAAQGFDEDEDVGVPPPPAPKAKVPQVKVSMIFKADQDGRENLRVWRAGLKKVKQRACPEDHEMGDSAAAAIMATHYMAAVPDASEGGLVMEVEYLCQAIETKYGVPLAVLAQGGLLARCREVLLWYKDDEQVGPLLKDIEHALRAGDAPLPADT
jgi:hypothetical protein